MPKIYKKENVLQAFFDRINFIFEEFDLILLSVSAGKDSSVMLQLVNIIAEKKNKKYDVMFIDLEAQYQATIQHVEELKKLSMIDSFFHVCLPLNLSNANSVFMPHWKCWDKNKEDFWVRQMPRNTINIDNHSFDNFYEGEEFESFILKFPKWLMKKKKKEKVACLIGIRTDESMNRFRSIVFGKNIYKDKKWSTKIKKSIFNFYPLYDWRTEDIWGAVSKYDLKYNKIYDLLYKNGVSIHEQRICQPYGHDQRVSLDQWAVLEPETWHKIVNRVSGANFGNIYCKSSLLGHNATEKPEFMSWEEYTVFLLESMGMYSEELMQHYIRKIKLFLAYYREKENIQLSDIQDELLPKEIREKYSSKHGKWIHWKRIARCVEKNDFSCRSLSYGITMKDKEDILKLKKKWGDLLGVQTHTKEMRELKEELNL